MRDDNLFDRRTLLRSGALAASATALPAWAAAPLETVPVTINTREVTGALPHIWEECVGSDRAAITLREAWRKDLVRGHKEAGFKRVRFHGIFNDELGVDTPTILNRRKPTPNFQNVFQVYDGLIENGVSPYVELGFMPQALASGTRTFGFYNGNISPPTSNEAWAAFISEFVTNLIDRYGLATVRSWPFEVWNEPNLVFFWSGTQQQYFDMYKATAVAIKSIDAQLQVGGPASSETAWLPEFASYCAQNNAPVDFFATHVYAGDNQTKLFGENRKLKQNAVIPEAIAQARGRINASSFSQKPLWLSEWSSDSPAMIAHVITSCLPHLHAMSHWTLTTVYEELGVAEMVLRESDGSFGMQAFGIAKPSFNTYKLLHALGSDRLDANGPVLASRRKDKSVAALLWNLADVNQLSGIPGSNIERTAIGSEKIYDIHVAGARAGATVRVRFVDWTRGCAMPMWRKMGSPKYLKPDQMALLRKAAEIAPPMLMKLSADGRLKLTLPSEGVALIEIA